MEHPELDGGPAKAGPHGGEDAGELPDEEALVHEGQPYPSLPVSDLPVELRKATP